MMPRQQPRNTTPPAPSVLAMILCDRVSVDPATKKSTLHGCFKTFAAARFPVTQPALAVHVMLTNGRGAVSIALHLVDVDEDQRIFTFEVPVEFPDPLATVDLTFAVRDVTFPMPGHYRLQLFAGRQLLVEQKLQVTQAQRVGAT